ncbi:MAG: hypothetical protein AB7P17_08800 [Nitrospirales bacterium]|nr:hypothetical protein [Nitrospirales bacterium]
MRKTIIVHVEGFLFQGSQPTHRLTPLERAPTPHLNQLANRGHIGQFQVPGESRPLRGALALLSLLGYETTKCYAGSGPFAAAGLEVKLEKHDVAFLCDLVTLRSEGGWGEGKKLGPQLIMDDPGGGGVSSEEARDLLDAINEQLVSENIQFYLGHHHRHLMVWAGGGAKVISRNPVEAVGQPIEPFLPTGDGGAVLRELMEASRVILSHHELNQERIADGGKPVNCLWMWDQGKALDLLPLNDRWPVTGAVISGDSAVLGAGSLLGLSAVRLDMGYENMSEAFREAKEFSLKAIGKKEFAYVHVPIAGKLGSPEDAMGQCWETLDTHLIGPLQDEFLIKGPNRLVVIGTPYVDDAPELSGGNGLSGYLLCDGKEALRSPFAPGFHEKVLATRPLEDVTKFFERLVTQ